MIFFSRWGGCLYFTKLAFKETYVVWSARLFGNNEKGEILAHYQDKESHC